jgi:hypothetical protein
MTRFEKFIALAAGLALIVYALSCRPAWSPDSSRVAFTYTGEKTIGVALYHVETGQTEKVVSFSGEHNDCFPQPLFYQDRVMVLNYRKDRAASETKDKEVLLMEFDLKTRSFTMMDILDLGDADVTAIVPPVLDLEGNIWIGGIEPEGYGLLKIDPKEKTVHPTGPDQFILINQGGGKVFYVSFQKKDKKKLEIGIFHPQEEAFRPITVLEDQPIDDLAAIIAAAPDGSGCCIPVEWEGGETSLLFVKQADGAIRRFDLPMEVKSSGGIAFSNDSATVWFVYIPKNEDASDTRPHLAEIHPEKGILRRVILPVNPEEINDDLAIALQPSLSPDGKWLAMSSVFFFEEESASPLFLVNIQSERLKVQSITPPIPSKEGL